MPVYRLSDEVVFPAPELAEESGLLAIGGDLRPERLILAYCNGIFPWPHEGLPLLWFSPDPRMVLRPGAARINKRLRRTIRNRKFRVTLDTAFRQVIEGCAITPRKHESGTWITGEMIEAYTELHRLGYAHSAECWMEDELVGGLYGVSIGTVMVGESMFSRESDASKVAFVTTLEQLDRWRFDLVDAQIHTPHLASLGGREWPRFRFLETLRAAVRNETRLAPWQIDPDLEDLRAYN